MVNKEWDVNLLIANDNWDESGCDVVTLYGSKLQSGPVYLSTSAVSNLHIYLSHVDFIFFQIVLSSINVDSTWNLSHHVTRSVCSMLGCNVFPSSAALPFSPFSRHSHRNRFTGLDVAYMGSSFLRAHRIHPHCRLHPVRIRKRLRDREASFDLPIPRMPAGHDAQEMYTPDIWSHEQAALNSSSQVQHQVAVNLPRIRSIKLLRHNTSCARYTVPVVACLLLNHQAEPFHLVSMLVNAPFETQACAQLPPSHGSDFCCSPMPLA